MSDLTVGRLFDLVRHQRSELHQADLITDDEYSILLAEKGSVQRLEDYDDLRRQLTASQARVKELEETVQAYSDESDAKSKRIATLEQALSVRDLALAAWSATFCKYVSWKANGVSNATLTEVIKDYERCSAISTALNEKEGK